MVMDFFEHQDVARKATGRLVLYFACAVAAIVVMAYLVVAGVVVYGSQGSEVPRSLWDPALLATVGLGTLIVVGLGSLYKLKQLSGGGRSVAELLGGRPLDRDTADEDGQRLLNVVEEMAIASGTPVPPVYVLEEEGGINAFAAGFSPDDAVIGVTRGALQHFDRDQLQGVVAHEFSHILNGDMRLNIRLMGVLHGILVIAFLGQMVLRSMRFAGRSRNSKNGGGAVAAVAAIGIGLLVVGYAGLFFGNLIKSAVSRQREYLADASAVQFTRNPAGIAGALQVIGGHAFGSALEARHAAEASHMFFGNGVKPFLGSIFATHPPLDQRIRRIDPGWDGEFVEPRRQIRDLSWSGRAAAQYKGDSPSPMQRRSAHAELLASSALLSATALVGRVTPVHLDYAREVLAELPEEVAAAAREPYGARAVVYALLLDADPSLREQQMRQLEQRADPGVVTETLRLAADVVGLPRRARLPLIELAMPRLTGLSASQRTVFRGCVERLVAADERTDLFEWVLLRLLRTHLDAVDDPAPERLRYYALGLPLKAPLEALLSTLARAGHPGDTPGAGRAFASAARLFDKVSLQFDPRETRDHAFLDSALDELRALGGAAKRTLLQACALCIGTDGQVTVEEAELLRAVADTLGVPMPPVLPGQPLV